LPTTLVNFTAACAVPPLTRRFGNAWLLAGGLTAAVIGMAWLSRLSADTHIPNGDAMTAWTSDELTRVGTAEELRIASLRRDGTLGSPRTIWVVRHGDDLYVRSVNGPASVWFRGTRVRHEGHVRAGGVHKDITFVDADQDINDQIDAEYRAKYGHYAAYIIDAITSHDARATTLRLMPRATSS
jgi:hypothetical protein